MEPKMPPRLFQKDGAMQFKIKVLQLFPKIKLSFFLTTKKEKRHFGLFKVSELLNKAKDNLQMDFTRIGVIEISLE